MKSMVNLICSFLFSFLTSPVLAQTDYPGFEAIYNGKVKVFGGTVRLSTRARVAKAL